MDRKVLILVIGLILLLPACQSNLVQPEDYSFDFVGGIEAYAPMISSVPGLPIKATCQLYKNGLELEVHYFCTQGSFLRWDNGPIEDLEDSAYLDFDNHTIYWSPFVDHVEGLDNDQPIEVHVDVLDRSNGMLVESSMHLIYFKDGHYSFDHLPE